MMAALDETRGWWRMAGRRLLDDIKVYCAMGQVVGTRYLMEPGYHLSERLFWLVTLLLSISFGIYHFYMGNKASFTIAISKISEPILFPPVSVCEISPWARTEVELDQRYLKYNVSEEFVHFIRAFVYQDISETTTIEQSWNYMRKSKFSFYYSKLDYVNLYSMIRSNCSAFLKHCSWQGESFDCCSHFRQVMTVLGPCFILWPSDTNLNMELTAYNFNEHPHLNITLDKPARLFILAYNGYPNHFEPWPRLFVNEQGSRVFIRFRLEQTSNEKEALDLNLRLLHCEPEALGRKEFSRCLNRCLWRLQIAACNCVSWNLQHLGQPCQLPGHVCLERAGLFPVHKIQRPLLRQCQCLLSCHQGHVMITNYTAHRSVDHMTKSSAYIELDRFPMLQLKRHPLHSILDLIVFAGGIMSLCLGCSCLSLLELLFVTLHRLRCGTYVSLPTK